VRRVHAADDYGVAPPFGDKALFHGLDREERYDLWSTDGNEAIQLTHGPQIHSTLEKPCNDILVDGSQALFAGPNGLLWTTNGTDATPLERPSSRYKGTCVEDLTAF
jgi:hypothetical protein